MSGIAGIWELTGRGITVFQLQQMAAALQRRGPDGSQIWRNASCGLVQTTLHCTPKSCGGNQPLTSSSGALIITADARIDNRDDLADELKLETQPTSDAHLILLAYEKWGDACCERLVGDFAFAIWDREKHSLYCARDHFGVRPLLYYHSQDLFVFASEIKAILSVSRVPRIHNEVRVADYLIHDLEGFDTESTFYERIFRLPAAHHMTVNAGQLHPKRYWSLNPSYVTHCTSEREYVEAFSTKLAEAIECRLRSSGTVGSMLSGGMDSSSVVALAQQLHKTKLHTFSAISAEPNCRETDSIRAMISHCNPIAHKVRPDQLESFVPDLQSILENMDDPFDSSIFHVPALMYIMARRQGVTVLLDGLDGDLVASLSLIYLALLLRCGRLGRAFNEARDLARFYERFSVSPWNLLFRFGIRPLIPAGARRIWRRTQPKARLEAALVKGTINPEFAHRIDLKGRLDSYYERSNQRLPESTHALHLRSLESSNITAGLERYERVASACAVECRHPFFDKRLVELCCSLPWEQKICEGWTKRILRHAMAGLLPDEVRWRRGWEHLGPEFSRSWHALLSEWIADILCNLDDVACYVNVKEVKRAHARLMSSNGQNDATLDDDRNRVWKAMTLVLWHRGSSRVPVSASTDPEGR